MKRTLVVGYFGHQTNQLDGQTIKTRSVHRLLQEEFQADVRHFDTQILKRQPLAIIKMFWDAFRCDRLVLIPAHNNLRYFFPVLFVLSRLSRADLLYVVVGGWLVEYLEHLPIHQKMLKHVRGIFPQTHLIKQQLEERYGYENVHVLPNFRFINRACVSQTERSTTFKVVFFARIHERKGLDYMAHLAQHILQAYDNGTVSMDFYGPLHCESELFFRENLLCHSFVSYKGPLEPDAVYSTLSFYDVLVLPTHYYTEGFPGSVLDAYLSSIPVIVTKWKHADEFVDNGETGFIIPFEKGESELCEKIDLLCQTPSLLREMKIKAGVRAKDYSPQAARKILAPYFSGSDE